MNTNSTISNLLNGSLNLDRMRKEIDTLLALVMGQVRSIYKVKSDHAREFRSQSNSGRWFIYRDIKKHSDNEYSYRVHCLAVGGQKCLFSQWANQKFSISAEEVQGIYDTLPDFLELVLREFPLVEEAWKPLISASEIIFPS